MGHIWCQRLAPSPGSVWECPFLAPSSQLRNNTSPSPTLSPAAAQVPPASTASLPRKQFLSSVYQRPQALCMASLELMTPRKCTQTSRWRKVLFLTQHLRDSWHEWLAKYQNQQILRRWPHISVWRNNSGIFRSICPLRQWMKLEEDKKSRIWHPVTSITKKGNSLIVTSLLPFS